MTFVEGLAIGLFVIAMLTMGAAITLSNGAVTRAVRRLERTYRQQKAWEREQQQAAALAAYQATLAQQLRADPDAWRPLVAQLVQRAYGGPERTPHTVTLRTTPAAHATVAFQDGGAEVLLTTDPPALAAAHLVTRAQAAAAIPVDAVLHPQARVTAQALWHAWLAGEGQTATLDAATAWYLLRSETPTLRGRPR